MNNETISLTNGTVWTLINRVLVYVLQFIAMLVLARTLCPEDFALMGIVTFFLTISQILIDAGMGASLLKKPDIANEDLSTLSFFSVGCGFIISLIIFICSPYFETLFKINNLSLYIRVATVSIIISAFGEVQNVLLLRNLKFKQLAIISVIASLLGLIVAILLAINGYGVWALIAQNLVHQFATVIIETIYNKYIPKLFFSLKSFVYQWNFGKNLLVSQILASVYQNLFSLIFPKISTLKFSGLYTQANKIQQIPISTITSVTQAVAFPVMAKIEDKIEFKVVNRKYIAIVNQLSFPLLLFIAIFSKEIIQILLGNQWVEAADILSILCFSGIGIIAIYNVRNTLKSLGYTKSILIIEVIKFIASILFIAIMYHWGDYAILFGLLLSVYVSMFLSMRILSKESNYTLKEQVLDFLEPFAISFITAVPFFVLRYIMSASIWVSILEALIYCVVVVLIYRYRKMDAYKYLLVCLHKMSNR